MNERIARRMGANMDIDFSNPEYGSSRCHWDADEPSTEHKCAVKNTSICPYFCGIQYLDSVLCSYPHRNTDVLSPEEMDRPM